MPLYPYLYPVIAKSSQRFVRQRPSDKGYCDSSSQHGFEVWAPETGPLEYQEEITLNYLLFAITFSCTDTPGSFFSLRKKLPPSELLLSNLGGRAGLYKCL